MMLQDVRKKYKIDSDGCLKPTENESDCSISLRINEQNTLMIDFLHLRNMSMENAVKAMLMAHTQFLTNYALPRFTSELETKDDRGVIDRFSNVPGRGVKRKDRPDQVNQTVAQVVASVAAAGAAGVASDAANAAATASEKASS